MGTYPALCRCARYHSVLSLYHKIIVYPHDIVHWVAWGSIGSQHEDVQGEVILCNISYDVGRSFMKLCKKNVRGGRRRRYGDG